MDTTPIIEIKGPAGSGKTALAFLVSYALEARNVGTRIEDSDGPISPEICRRRVDSALVGRVVTIRVVQPAREEFNPALDAMRARQLLADRNFRVVHRELVAVQAKFEDARRELAAAENSLVFAGAGEAAREPATPITLPVSREDYDASVRMLESAEITVLDPRGLTERLADVLGEMLADAETMNAPYRNEAICERARAVLAEAEDGGEPTVRDAYAGGLCPDCQTPIPADAADGQSCANCGHALYAKGGK
jgi:hypothetical protein